MPPDSNVLRFSGKLGLNFQGHPPNPTRVYKSTSMSEPMESGLRLHVWVKTIIHEIQK